MKGAALPLLAGILGCSALVDPDRERLDTDPYCDDDAECNDGLYCNGVEECVARHCNPTQLRLPCDDEISCTIDFCDDATTECDNQPSDDSCPQDPVEQICDAADGCVPVGG